MSKKKRRSDPDLLLETRESDEILEPDATRPDMGEGALLAAVDQAEAVMTGEAEPTPQPAEKKPVIALRVFAQLGPKWDQMAGFKNYAKRSKLEPMTVPEWRAAYEAFRKRPV